MALFIESPTAMLTFSRLFIGHAKGRVALLVAVAVFVTAVSGLLVTQDNGRLASIWSANAIILSALLLTPPRQWPILLSSVLLANVAANLVIGDSMVTAVLLALCNILETLVGASLLSHIQKNQTKRINPAGSADNSSEAKDAEIAQGINAPNMASCASHVRLIRFV